MRSIYKQNNKKQSLATLCSSSELPMGSQGTTLTVLPTKWASISLIWPEAKYSHNFFFVQNTLKLVDGGNHGGWWGREHNVTQLPPLALKWLQMPLTNSCQSENTCNTLSAGFCSLDRVWVTKREEKKLHTWVWSNSTILRRNTASLVLKTMKGIEFPTQMLRIRLAWRKCETLTKAVESPHNLLSKQHHIPIPTPWTQTTGI